MLGKTLISLRKSAWLLALLILTSALPASAQDEPYLFVPAEDGSGYIMRPRPDVHYEQGVLDVPAVRESDGIPIVGVDGFSYQERLLGIQFYEGSKVKYIGSFQGCPGIEFIANMPATVEKIADYAFNGCTRLREVTLNDGLKYIGISCFEGCTSLTSIKLPKSLKVLRENAFRVCTALQTVEFDDNINFHDGYSYGFYNNVFDGCTNLTSVKLPKNSPGNFVIPMATFSWCGSLKSIEFPANTSRIDQKAFYRSGIENLDFTTITSEVFYLSGYYTFAACESLKSVTANGNFQFSNTSLYTFQDCKALETVTVNGSGDDFIAITPDAFRWCEKLKSVEVYRLKGTGDVNNEMDSVFVGCKSLQKVISTCPAELNKIGYSCFDGCESLEEVPIPEQAFKINMTAFRGCAALQSLDLANVTSIGTQAFTGCSKLTSISINDIPTMEKEDAFDEWHFANTEIAVPDDKYSDFTTDAYWKQFSHYKHPSLFAYTEVTGGFSISKSPYALDEDFTGTLVIPEQYNSGNVVAIAAGTFQGLTGLTGVTLPSGLTSIGSQAFAGCTGITTVINKAVSPLSGENCPVDAFDQNTYTNGTLNVPFGSLDAYESFAPWANFTGRIKQGFGERSFSAPVASQNEGEYDHPIELTLTNPNNIGTIYYYIINEGEGNVSNEVHTVKTYSTPIRISANCTVVAQISDGTNCSEPVSLEYTLRYNTVSDNAGLLSMEPDKFYQVNVNLQGVKVNGGVLYARTSETSAAPSKPKETHTGFDSYEDGNKLGEYDQRDWVAIEGLTSEYERKQIEVGFVARYDSSKLIPVTTPVSGTDIDVELNTFGVANVFYGNYENTERLGWKDGNENPYYPFFVKAKVNEVANFVGTVTVTEGKIELWGSGVCGKLNEKGLAIDANGKEINASEGVYQQIEGVLVADAEANGGVKLVALSKPITPTGVAALKADGKATIYGTEGAVVVNGADGKVMIFDAMGRMVKSVSAEGAATVAMPAGYYIVRTAGTAKAVIVK